MTPRLSPLPRAETTRADLALTAGASSSDAAADDDATLSNAKWASVPAEIHSLIFDELSNELDPPRQTRERHRAGVACCLVSRSFLPHGRRVLYSHLTNHATGETTFAARIEHLRTHPVLASFVRVCTINALAATIQSDVEGAVVDRIESALPNLPELHLVELFDESEGNSASEVDTDEARRHILGSLAAPASNLVTRLRHLSIGAWRGAPRAAEYVALILERAGRLESLELDDVGHCYRLCETGCPPTPRFHLPHLTSLSVRRCSTNLAAALITRSPTLRHLSFSPLGRPWEVFPLLPTPHEGITSITYTTVRGTQAVYPGWDPPTLALHHTSLGAFLSSFPSLTSLSLTDTSTSHSFLPLSAPPPSPTSQNFLLALPRSLRVVRAFGMAFVSLFLSSSALIASGSGPQLTLLSLQWLHDPSQPRSGLPSSSGPTILHRPIPDASSALATACATRGIRIGGTLVATECVMRLMWILWVWNHWEEEGLREEDVPGWTEGFWNKMGRTEQEVMRLDELLKGWDGRPREEEGPGVEVVVEVAPRAKE